MLRKYRTALPQKQWKTLCMSAMHALQATVDELKGLVQQERALAPVATSACKEAPVDRHRPMEWDALGPAMLAMQQHILCTMHDTVIEKAPVPVV